MLDRAIDVHARGDMETVQQALAELARLQDQAETNRRNAAHGQFAGVDVAQTGWPIAASGDASSSTTVPPASAASTTSLRLPIAPGLPTPASADVAAPTLSPVGQAAGAGTALTPTALGPDAARDERLAGDAQVHDPAAGDDVQRASGPPNEIPELRDPKLDPTSEEQMNEGRETGPSDSEPHNGSIGLAEQVDLPSNATGLDHDAALVPARSPARSQWMSESAAGGRSDPHILSDETPDSGWQPGVQYAGRVPRAPRGAGSVLINGRWLETSTAQVARLASAQADARAAISRVHEVDHPGDYATLNSYQPRYGTS